MSDAERRKRGIEMMKKVYGWDVGDPEGAFTEMTFDHLFGDVWSRDVMSIRERRLLLIGLLVGYGLDDVVELQLESGLRLGELEPDELREIVVFLTHYAGWPRGAKLNGLVEKLLAQGQATRGPE
ncbi:MAG: carboxymuconolactone decarboxylase family protein [Actinomycetota bacterium]